MWHRFEKAVCLDSHEKAGASKRNSGETILLQEDVIVKFDGKVGLVTGAASGIGRATAIGFAQRGGAIAVVDINGEGANKVADEIDRAGGKAIAIVADVTRAADLDMMFAKTTSSFGRLDFLHNNAFGLPPATGNSAVLARTGEITDDVWNRMIDVGLTAVFQGTKRAIAIMRKQGGGAIVNTASISGQRGDYGIVAYNAAKAGVINLTRVTAIEYARDGIRVNCICPGVIDTPLLAAALVAEDARMNFTRGIPMGRLGRPEEMANVVLFLASDLASFVTGAAFVADGGQTAKTGSPSFLPD
jgi:meso-butanediol dehydrogenase/(S,S)-butanediol dehydrogenase/diacetyl reductase